MKMKKESMKGYVKDRKTGDMVKPNTRENITETIKMVKKGGGSTKKLENKRRKLADKEGPARKA